MNLHKKVLSIIALTFLLLIFILAGMFKKTLLQNFITLEEQLTRQNTERVVNTLQSEIDTLSSFAMDWARWDDTYNFMKRPDEAFINSNMVDETFIDQRLNYIALVNTAGEIVYSKMFDLETEEEQPFLKSLLGHLTADSLLLHHPSFHGTSGLLQLPEGLMLITSHAVLTSENKGPGMGSFVLGRFLRENEIRRISKITRLNITAYKHSTASLLPELVPARDVLDGKNRYMVRALDENRIAGYALLDDVFKMPALIIKVETPRTIYLEGRTAVKYNLLSILLAVALFTFIIILVLDRLVLAPLSRMDSRVHMIGSTGDISVRVHLPGSDELARLGQTINATLDRLQQAQEQVEHSRQQYRAIVEDQTELICRFDARGTLSFANEAFGRFFDTSAENAIGKNFFDFMPAEDREAVKADIAVLSQRQSNSTFETQSTQDDGRIRWLSWTGRALFSDQGVFKEIQAVGQEITGRKQAEQEREQVINELTQALAEIKQLSGLLPICSHCKKIRDDRGYWHQVESYIEKSSEAFFSHSICPDCARENYPDLYKKETTDSGKQDRYVSEKG